MQTLNPSMQVGDLIFVDRPIPFGASNDSENIQPVDHTASIGLLRKIEAVGEYFVLYVEDVYNRGDDYIQAGDFIMFSKYNQAMGDLIGYYAEVRFDNWSREKAEIFSVGSEVTINSK